jgi:hypothetical protein
MSSRPWLKRAVFLVVIVMIGCNVGCAKLQSSYDEDYLYPDIDSERLSTPNSVIIHEHLE